MQQLNLRSILYALSTLFLLSCGEEVKVTLKQELMANILAQANELIADKSCNNKDGCEVIAWGVDLCGNTRMFLVYAPGNTDVVQLEQLAASYNQLEREVNVVLGGAELIDCSVFLIRPKLECVEMVCESSDPAYGVIN